MIKRYITWYGSLSVLAREAIRISLCLIVVTILAAFLSFGLRVDGTIKPWAEIPIETLTSPKLLELHLSYFVYIFTLSLFVALLTGSNVKYKSKLNFAATVFTGVFYCSGFSAFVVAYYAYPFAPEASRALISYGFGNVVLGLASCYVLQMLIQGTPSPKMR